MTESARRPSTAGAGSSAGWKSDFDLHIALEVDRDTLQSMFEKGKVRGIETRGIADHGFVHSIYFRDPNGYVIELAAPTEPASATSPDERKRAARRALDSWQSSK